MTEFASVDGVKPHWWYFWGAAATELSSCVHNWNFCVAVQVSNWCWHLKLNSSWMIWHFQLLVSCLFFLFSSNSSQILNCFFLFSCLVDVQGPTAVNVTGQKERQNTYSVRFFPPLFVLWVNSTRFSSFSWLCVAYIQASDNSIRTEREDIQQLSVVSIPSHCGHSHTLDGG